MTAHAESNVTTGDQATGSACRLDAALARLGVFETREQARRSLIAGEIEIDGRRDAKPGTPVRIVQGSSGPELMRGRARLEVHLRAKPAYVSRGGQKLEAALDALGICPRGMTALDIGASTGGFTDCLLQRGAAKVYAVDCGTGQLHAKLRSDPRVMVLERTNARFLSRAEVPEQPAVVVVDVSFISLRLILPAIAAVAGPGTVVIVLVKPQFEAGPDKVGKGGVVRDEAVRLEAVEGIREAMTAMGWACIGMIESPLVGPAGNHEYLLAARL